MTRVFEHFPLEEVWLVGGQQDWAASAASFLALPQTLPLAAGKHISVLDIASKHTAAHT